MGKIARLIEHIHRGTLLERIQGKRMEQIKKKRKLRWETHKGRLEYLDAKIEHGLRMRLHFDSELARLIYCDDFELRERHFVSAFLKPGDVFVDVGANIGLYSLLAAKCVGDSGMVYAFEPSAKTFYRLHENTRLNDLHNIQCFQLALSDEPGEFPFYTSEDGYDAWNSIAYPIAGKSFTREFIQCVTWDGFARLHQLIGTVTMMKIDVEGWESRVLEGAKESFSRENAPLLQVEFTEKASASAGSSCQHLYYLLESLGYQMFVYNPEKHDLVPDPIKTCYPYQNLIATKLADKVRERLRHENPFKRFWRELNWP